MMHTSIERELLWILNFQFFHIRKLHTQRVRVPEGLSTHTFYSFWFLENVKYLCYKSKIPDINDRREVCVSVPIMKRCPYTKNDKMFKNPHGKCASKYRGGDTAPHAIFIFECKVTCLKLYGDNCSDMDCNSRKVRCGHKYALEIALDGGTNIWMIGISGWKPCFFQRWCKCSRRVAC